MKTAFYFALSLFCLILGFCLAIKGFLSPFPDLIFYMSFSFAFFVCYALAGFICVKEIAIKYVSNPTWNTNNYYKCCNKCKKAK